MTQDDASVGMATGHPKKLAAMRPDEATPIRAIRGENLVNPVNPVQKDSCQFVAKTKTFRSLWYDRGHGEKRRKESRSSRDVSAGERGMDSREAALQFAVAAMLRRLAESHTLDMPIAMIDQYEVLQELGSGGFGSVFLARDTISKILVAIKGLPDTINRREEERVNLRRNFSLIAKLHHPNIASPLVLHPANRVHYVDRAAEKALRIHSGDCFLVMEFVRGDTLLKWKSKHHVSKFLDYARVIMKIAEALDFAHGQGILHRDVKPSNVMVRYLDNSELEVKVLDFVLAAELKLSMN